MCPPSDDRDGLEPPDRVEPASNTASTDDTVRRRDAGGERTSPTSGFARRDFEVIDARRVERADLVRDLLRRRRAAATSGDEPAAEPAAEPTPAPATDDTVEIDRAHGPIARGPDARGAADARDAAGSRAESGSVPRLRALPDALTGEAPNLDDTIRISRDPGTRRRSGPATGASERDESPAATPASPPPAPHPGAPHPAAPHPAGPHPGHDADSAEPAPHAPPYDAAPPTAAIPIPDVPPTPEASPADASAAAIGLLRRWRAEAESARAAVAEAQLHARTEGGRDRLDPTGDLRRAVEGEGGREFLRDLLDDVIRPDDHIVAGHGLGDLTDRVPSTLSRRARRAFRLGVVAGPGMPWIAVPVLRRTARAFFDREFVVDRPDARAAATSRIAEQGATVRAVLLGDRVVGYGGAADRIHRMLDAVADPSIAELEYTIADVEPVANLWDLDGTVERVAAAITPVYLAALGGADAPPTKLVLRATSSTDLELAVRVFQRVLGEAQLLPLEAGISIPAEFPEAAGIVRRLAGWAHLRREDLGAPITIGITRAGDIELERVDAVLGGRGLASFADRRDVDASVVRLLDQALHADHAGAIRVEIDGDVLRDAALAIALAEARGARSTSAGVGGLRVVVALGAGDAAVTRVREAGAAAVVRMPILLGDAVRPAVPYLLRRVDQEADSVAALEFTEATVAGRDQLHPDDERVLEAVGRMFRLPGGPNRFPERVDADDAATVTASIQLELFPDGLLDDDHEGRIGSGESARGDADAAPLDRAAAAVAAAPGAPGLIPRLDHDSGADESGAGADAAGGDVEGALIPPGAHAAQRPAAPIAPVAHPVPGAADEPPVNPADTGPSARLTEIVLGLRRGRYVRNSFRNTPDTDPTIAEHRAWISRIQRRIGRSVLGFAEADAALVSEPEQIDAALERGVAAGADWRAKPGWERAAHLERVAKGIEANRARLIEVAVSEFGVPVADADGDVSRAIDVANHAAHLARQLDRMQGAAFHPVGLTVVLPPSSPPVAGASGSALTALAAGSPVIVKASPKTRRTAGVLASVLWACDVPRDLVQLVVVDETLVGDEQLARRLVTDERVERVLLNGEWETARTMLRWRPDLPLIAGTNGKNAIIVTPAADLDQAALDVARSAFLSTGQRSGHCGTVILVGSVARSDRFVRQLADAVTAIAIGYPSDPGATAGPLVHPADGSLRFALTQLAEGERWLVEPRQLDDTGRLWTPGVKLGVQPGSYAHVTEFFGPVLSVMSALTLDQAIGMQNATRYGLVAGLQSHDRAEIGRWIANTQAGGLFVNRDTLGNTVQRHPFGGWKRSSVGTFQKSGGPNALMALGEWRIDPGQPSPTLHLRGMDAKAVALIEAAQPSLDYAAFDRVRRTALSCQIAWNEEFGEASDVTGLAFERNLLRYVPAAVTVRLAEGAPLEELVRVLAAARIVRAVPDVSTAAPVPDAVGAVLAELQFAVRVESDAEFAARLREHGADSLRIRLIGGSRRDLCEALDGDPDVAVWSGPVTFAGHVELLPFVREQSISITSHRHGRRDPRVDAIFAHERVLDPERPFA